MPPSQSWLCVSCTSVDVCYSLNSQKAQQGVHMTVVACFSLKDRKLSRVFVLLRLHVTPPHEWCSKQTTTATLGVPPMPAGVQLVPSMSIQQIFAFVMVTVAYFPHRPSFRRRVSFELRKGTNTRPFFLALPNALMHSASASRDLQHTWSRCDFHAFITCAISTGMYTPV